MLFRSGYVVQVAALNDADKAKQMRDQIAAAGIKAYTEVVPTAKGNVTRVRAGPFAERADAERARREAALARLLYQENDLAHRWVRTVVAVGGHSADCIIAARCPPAECPHTVMRERSAPYSPA